MTGIFAALLIFWAIVRTHRYFLARPAGRRAPNHFPAWWIRVWNWVNSQLSREPEPEPEPEPRVVHYDWGAIDYTDAPTHVVVDQEKRPAPVVDPVRPTAVRSAITPLQEWISQSVSNGARSVDIIREGARKFGASESTVKRGIKKAKATRR